MPRAQRTPRTGDHISVRPRPDSAVEWYRTVDYFAHLEPVTDDVLPPRRVVWLSPAFQASRGASR